MFDKAAAALADAYKVLGPVDLNDTAAIVKAGPEATAGWANARDALFTIEAMTAGWMGLHELLTNAIASKPRRLLMLADITAETWIDDNLDHAPADPWLALRNSYPLALGAVHDFGRRIAEIDEERQCRVDATPPNDTSVQPTANASPPRP